ncbi:MAG: sodium:proton antiporter [Gammaproteobacteria bacterium]|nr:sodium:proton antiporter [Gammaproteobacteria bacterium]
MIGILPLVLFVLLFLGGGLFFSALGIKDAFYQLPPMVAILPAIALAWYMRGKGALEAFFSGVGHRDILLMCSVFLLAGAFGQITKDIGAVDAVVNLGLSVVSPQWLVVGIFAVSAFIGTAIGTSMGVIIAVAPVVVAMGTYVHCDMALMMGAVVGGAMFGDNLSLVSDTTIASVSSLGADGRRKFVLNAKLALMSALICSCLLFDANPAGMVNVESGGQWILTLPYALLLCLSLCHVNVFLTLIFSTVFAVLIGVILTDYSVLHSFKGIQLGFLSMADITLLSLMIAGLSGLIGRDVIVNIGAKLSAWVEQRGDARLAQFLMIKLGLVCDMLLANNTIAIIIAAPIIRQLADRYHIKRHIAAAWIDISSCVMQGLIPYGAQILLASSLAGVSPLMIALKVYYCWILGLVLAIYVYLWGKKN